jgi:hypothetical protein
MIQLFMHIVPATWRLKQEDCLSTGVQASLGYMARYKEKKKTGNGKILLCPFQNSLSEEEVMMAPEHITQVPGSSLR